MDLGTPDFIGFPEEIPQYHCRLAFRKYSRPTPGSNPTQFLEAVYRLPIPSSLLDQFNMDTSDPKLDILGGTREGFLQAGGSRVDQFANEFGNIGDYRGTGAAGFMKLIGLQSGATQNLLIDAAALAPGLSDSAPGHLAQLTIGRVRNPHHTLIFQGVSLKTYSFTWKMSPRSQAEAITLEKIIKNIKMYMHPNLSPTGFSLEYPHLAELSFVVGDNQLVPNVKTSFLKNLTVNSSGGGVPSFYKDGRSTIVEMGLSFQEINVQTREDFSPDTQQAATTG